MSRGLGARGLDVVRATLARHQWGLVALIAGVVYLALSWHWLHFQDVIMDEGAYLYKGWLFVRGVYRPFQPYGPWTNKMPLSFLLYGAVQRVFAPGLATGRYFSVAASASGWLAAWLLVRRLGHPRLAAGLLWAAVATVSLVRVETWAVTEGFSAAVMVWALFFLLDPSPSRGQLLTGGVLAGLAAVLRINLTLFTVLVVFWMFWLHGWRRARWTLLGAVLPIAVVYGLYWPDILRLWFPWLPAPLQRALPWYGLDLGRAAAPQTTSLLSRLMATAEMLRTHPLPWLGLLLGTGATLARPGLTAAKDAPFRPRVLQGLTLVVWGLVLLHFAATIGKGGGLLFQMPVYWAFFAPLALILGALAWGWAGEGDSPWVHRLVVGGALFLAAVGLLSQGYQTKKVLVLTFDALGKTVRRFVPWVPATPFANPNLLPGLAVGGLLGLLGLVAAGWVGRRLRQKSGQRASPGTLALLAFLALSPLPWWSGSFHPYDCPTDALAQNRRVAAELAAEVPPHALVYLQGVKSVTVLLELPFDVRTFPPQYNARFNYRLGGDPDTLYRLGYWNAALAARWRQQADVFLISKSEVLRDQGLTAFLQRTGFREYHVTAPLAPCSGGPVLSRIAVYKRYPKP